MKVSDLVKIPIMDVKLIFITRDGCALDVINSPREIFADTPTRLISEREYGIWVQNELLSIDYSTRYEVIDGKIHFINPEILAIMPIDNPILVSESTGQASNNYHICKSYAVILDLNVENLWNMPIHYRHFRLVLDISRCGLINVMGEDVATGVTVVDISNIIANIVNSSECPAFFIPKNEDGVSMEDDMYSVSQMTSIPDIYKRFFNYIVTSAELKLENNVWRTEIYIMPKSENNTNEEE